MSNKFKGKALNHNVIVKEKFVDNKTKHGIDLTGIVDANEKQKRGIVVSIGELCPYVNVRIFGFRIPFWKKQTIKLKVLVHLKKNVHLNVHFCKYNVTFIALSNYGFSHSLDTDLVNNRRKSWVR